MRRPIAIDLFSGCGGMSLGLEASGFDIVAAIEFDPIHAVVHHLNFPYTVRICKDISNLASSDLLNAIKSKGFSTEIDLISGSPPCQGFSHIGKRQLDDPRNSLVFEFLRIIKEVQPKYFIFENVPGIASGKHKKFLDELIVEFEAIGYQIEKPIKILDASCFGAPQTRKRLIVIGSRKGLKKATYPQFTHGNITENPSLFNYLKKMTTVGDAIKDLEIHDAFIGEDQEISPKKLDYSGFRESFSFDLIGKKLKYLMRHQKS